MHLSAQYRSDFFYNFIEGEIHFDKIIRGAQALCLLNVLFAREIGQDNNFGIRSALAPADFAQCLKTIFIRQEQIQQDDARPRFLEHLQSISAGLGADDVKSGARQRLHEQVAHEDIIFNQQDDCLVFRIRHMPKA